MSTDRGALEAVAATLRRAGATEPDLLALDVIHILRGHGWRPTQATPDAADRWRHQDGPPASREAARQHAAQARADLLASLEAERARPVPPAPSGRGEP